MQYGLDWQSNRLIGNSPDKIELPMPNRRVAILLLVSIAILWAGKKKNPDDLTQTLDLPKDPPAVAIGEASRLTFQISPLSNKGLLSQQTRDALKAILKANGGAPVIHIRAFVAGSGDLRRVPQIVSEVLTEKKMALPSVSVIQAGALSLQGAQVVLEAVSEAKRPMNPDGLTFVPAQNPAALDSAISATCFVSDVSGAVGPAGRFPAGTAVDFVQSQRRPSGKESVCEGIMHGGNVRAAKLAFTGTQIALGTDEKAASVAFQRIDRELSEAGVQVSDIVMTHIYPLSVRIGELAQKVRAATSPVSVVPIEGVAAIDGSFAVDSIAAVKQ